MFLKIVWTFAGAKSRGVNFALFNIVISAPFTINNLASCTRPSSQAKCLKIINYTLIIIWIIKKIIVYSGVFPYESLASTCIPGLESNNNLSTDILPFDAHLCNGVAPRLSAMSTSAFFDSKYLTI